MASKAYCDLIDEICKLSGLTQPELLYERADLVVEEIGFSVLESQEPGEPALYWLCEFGTLPVEYRSAALQRLLEANYFSFGNNTPSFGINYDTERVLLMGRSPLSAVNAEALLRAFAEHAAMAKEWRRSYLLVEPGQPLPSASTAAKSRRWIIPGVPAM